MKDSMTEERIVVSVDGDAGPYIIVPLVQLAAIEDLLSSAGIRYATDKYAISLNGEPEVSIVNLGSGADVDEVQAVLDQAS